MPTSKAHNARKNLRAGALINPRRGSASATVRLEASLDAGAPGPRLAPRPALVPTADPAPGVRLPPVSEVRLFSTSRLLPAKYSESVLTRIAETDADLPLIFALDNATNDRLLGEADLRLGITSRELVFEVPYWRIINAAYTHPHPQGARFSMPYRGAWYAGLELPTAKAEVLFHRSVQFAEIAWQQPEELEYDQYTADFSGCFHDLRPAAFSRATQEPAAGLAAGLASERRALAIAYRASRKAGGGRQPGVSAGMHAAFDLPGPPEAEEFAACLSLDSYVASQQLAIDLLEAGSLGILYPSARRPGGNCIACFRPSVVANVRKRDLYCLRWYPDRAATFVRSPRGLPPETSSLSGGEPAESSARDAEPGG